MNIFVLDREPIKCAQYHNDKHVVKMILESCQLLCTAHRVLDGQEYTGKTQTGRNVRRWTLDDYRESIFYHATHINHPCAVWCRASLSNYRWLWSLTLALSNEYTFRYGKIHKCKLSGLIDDLIFVPNTMQAVGLTPFAQAMPVDCQRHDAVEAYRTYYRQEKHHLASWTHRDIPEWYHHSAEEVTTCA